MHQTWPTLTWKQQPEVKRATWCCASDTNTLSRLTGLWMAVVGAVVTLAGSTASAAEVEETWVAFITLGSIHSRLARTYPWAERGRTEVKIDSVQNTVQESISLNVTEHRARDEEGAVCVCFLDCSHDSWCPGCCGDSTLGFLQVFPFFHLLSITLLQVWSMWEAPQLTYS